MKTSALCQTNDDVLAFDAHAKEMRRIAPSEIVHSQETLPDGRVRHTAHWGKMPDDVAHEYLPPDASEEAIAKVRATLADRFARHVLRDTPEHAAGRQRITREHNDKIRKEAESKRLAARAEFAKRKPSIVSTVSLGTSPP